MNDEFLSVKQVINGNWLSVKEFAEKKGVSVQSIYKSKKYEMKKWKGLIVVRE